MLRQTHKRMKRKNPQVKEFLIDYIPNKTQQEGLAKTIKKQTKIQRG